MLNQQRLNLCFFTLNVATSHLAFAQSDVPDALRALVGEYKGEWTSYGIDETGKVAERMSWTDVLIAKAPQVESDKAFVTFTNPMAFRGADKPFMTVTGKEGYTLKAGGEVVDYFIETFGQTYTAKRLSDNVWAYSMPAYSEELATYGFSDVVSGEHVMVKVHTNENGVSTHRISRVTTVNWKDAEGKLRWIQYTSLKGVHRRVTSKE